ncbi:MAG: NADH:flavin oxidoreductase [Alphaproteobacteria bacterium]|nr:NADH:flavin oxidoreductase [Alphaproteobacteria bacterium]
MSHPVTAPVSVGPLRLRNRVVKTATFEGMSPGGRVGDALIDHHATLARHGVALTTVAYGAVAADGRTFADQLLVDEHAVPGLRALADAVHAHGGAVSLQLAHCGGFSKLAASGAPKGPSAAWNAYGLAEGVGRVRPMDEGDLASVVDAFARAARHAADAGFDAVEVHCGHGYLLSQFLSPAINRRRDAWGGSLDRRLRLPLDVVRAVRQAVGPDVAVLAKVNTRDGFAGGLEIDEAVDIAVALVEAGVDGLVPSGGVVFRTPFFLMRGGVPLAGMASVQEHALQRWSMRLFGSFIVRPFPYTSTFFFDDALRIARAVDVPVGLLGGVDSDAAIRRALDAGFGFVVMGRSLLAEPDLLARLAAGPGWTSACTRGNACVVEMDRGGVRCVRSEGRCPAP